MRTFIAIDLDETLKTNLEALIRVLGPLGHNVRWVSAPGMHLTLKFLGEIPDQDVQGIVSVLEPVVRQYRPFALVLKGTGVFPPGRRNPRVLWVGFDHNPSLSALQQAVDVEMEKLGFERENREFHPHLTLGRVKFPGRMDQLLQELEKSQATVFGDMQVGKVILFKSTLRPSGAEYSILAEFRLG
jgi:2'-5' RNA ligase